MALESHGVTGLRKSTGQLREHEQKEMTWCDQVNKKNLIQIYVRGYVYIIKQKLQNLNQYFINSDLFNLINNYSLWWQYIESYYMLLWFNIQIHI